jgi:HK97 family phage major capsid protein
MNFKITTQAELDEMMNDVDQFNSFIDGKAREMAGVMVAEQLGDQVGKQMDAAIEKFAKTLTKSGLKRLPQSDAHNPDAPGAAGDGDWKRMAEFLVAMTPHQIQRNGLDSRLKVLGEGSGDQGGFLVPEEFRAELLSVALENAIIRPRAFTIPMGSDKISVPVIRDASHASNVHGGVRAYWTPESGSITASEPTFAQAALEAKKLAGYTSTTNELAADSSISLEALIIRMFGGAIEFFEEEAFLNGDGAAQPTGILNAAATISVAKETAQAATTIVLENILAMWARLLPTSQGNAIWLAHPDTFPQLATMALNVGTGGGPVWMASVVGGAPVTIMGRPLFFSEKCQTLGTVGDLYLIDPSYYMIGDRQAVTMAASPHVRFQNDETVFRFTERLDGRPWLDTALTPRYGADTLSAFVTLATRA